jgi:prophage tail gpP-like protein
MASARPRDTVRVEVVSSSNGQAGGALDNFTTLEITNDITMPNEAMFEVGDDVSWSRLGDVFALGTQFMVFVNDVKRLTGRVEMNNAPFDVGAGAVIRFAVRTKLSDAMFASALQNTQVKNVSIQDFILKLYAPLGYAKKDFEFAQQASRNLLTGLDGNTGETAKDLEKIKLEEARVNPPESIYAAADRHLRRHGLMHWDSPDGRIVVGAPNDSQDPTFKFNLFRTNVSGDPNTNNVLSGSRTRDWSGVPGRLAVYGRGGKRDFTKSSVSAVANDDEVVAAGFYRPVFILAEGIRTQALAQAAAARELSARSKRKDSYQIEVDGLSYWTGSQVIQYATDTVAQINSDVAGGTTDPYYVHSVTMTRSAAGGDTTQLNMVKRGLWKLA